MANDVQADVSSGGSINIHPIVSLKAEASSGGNVHYEGSPSKIEKSESSGGNVTKG